MPINKTPIELEAACLVAAAQVIASGKPGMTGGKGTVYESVATLACDILKEYMGQRDKYGIVATQSDPAQK